MQCLYCGKSVGLLRGVGGKEFCCAEHKRRYRELTKLGLARLLEAEESSAPSRMDGRPETPTAAGGHPELKYLLNYEPFTIEETFTKPAPSLSSAPRSTREPSPAPSQAGFVRPSWELSATASSPQSVWVDPVPAWANLPAKPSMASLADLRTQFAGTPSPGAVEPTRAAEAFAVLPMATSLEAQSAATAAAVLEPAPLWQSASSHPVLPTAPLSSLDGPGTAFAFAGPVISLPAAIAGAAGAWDHKLDDLAPFEFQVTCVRDFSQGWRLHAIDFPVDVETELVSTRLSEQLVPEFGGISPVPLASRAATSVDPEPWRFPSYTVEIDQLSDSALSVSGCGFASIAPVSQDIATQPVLESEPLPLGVNHQVPFPERVPELSLGVGRELSWRPAAVAPAAGASADGSVIAQHVSVRPRLAPTKALAVHAARQTLTLGPALARLEAEASDDMFSPVGSPAPLATEPGFEWPFSRSLVPHRGITEYAPLLPIRQESIAAVGRNPRLAAFDELAPRFGGPFVPASSPLRIVETFQYLKPSRVERQWPTPWEVLLRLWRTTPAFAKLAAAGVSLAATLWIAAPQDDIANMAQQRLQTFDRRLQERAALQQMDEFQDGMENWDGVGNAPPTWSFNRAGYTTPGRLALYRPSRALSDYRVEFLAQIERRSVGWVFRAADHENYYATKLTVVEPGPLPSMALVRYPVIGGKVGPRVQMPIRMIMHNNTPYRVEIRVQGGGFSTSIEGKLVDYWTDDRLKVGGVGFFSDSGERSRLYWMKLAHQDDFIGRVCGYLAPKIQAVSESLQ